MYQSIQLFTKYYSNRILLSELWDCKIKRVQ